MQKSRWSPSVVLLTKYSIYFIALHVLQASAFNIEQRLPLVRTGEKGSLFGLSIAQHHIKVDSSDPNDAVLLVGAPTAERAPEHSKDSVKPGGFYKCPVYHNQDCERVIVTPPVNTLRANCSYQWLGVKVKSHRPGGKIAVCAHRYTIRGGSRNIIAWEAAIGRCFMLESTVEPVKNRLSFEWMPCLGKQDNNGAYSHEGFGYCQAGYALDFADFPNGDRTEEFLVIGAPGSRFWSGAFYTSQLNPQLFPVNLWSNDSPDNPDKNSLMGGVQVSSTSTDIFTPVSTRWLLSKGDPALESEEVPQKNSLLGSSLTSGVLLNGRVNYVSGAPGVNATGAVVILENSEGSPENLDIVEVLYGEGVATRFGHEVQLVDVTGDGRLDLIVGAPQYYNRELKQGGAVYIYVNKGLGQIGPDPTQILYGNVDSAFGMSISSINDVNMDGAVDIAIGAPGEDKGRGAVYIYHGKSGTGVGEEPSQVIRASELLAEHYMTGNITGMGYSVSAGLDMDMNGYPDLAAGSLSDSVVMFQSRPIVNIAGSIKGPDKKIILGDMLDTSGYEIEICLNYTSEPKTFNDEVRVTCNVLLDTARLGTDLLPRASFSKSDKSAYEKTVLLTLYPQSRRRNKCKTLKAYIDKDLQDKLSPIELQLEFTTPDTMPKRRKRDAGLPKPMPVMNAAIENTATSAMTFSKNCGPDEICRSKLFLTAYYEILKGGAWEAIEEDEDGVPMLKLGTEEQIGMVIEVTNPLPGEGAHQAELVMELPDVLEYRSTDDIKPVPVPDLHCDPEKVNETEYVRCTLGNPFKSDAAARFRVKLSKRKAIYQSTGFTVNLQLHTTSVQPGHDDIKSYEVKVHVEAQLDILGYPNQEQVKFGGKVIGESAVQKSTDAGETLVHNYEVKNTGTGPANNVMLHIKWPQTIKNGKWLFYLLEAEVKGNKGNCTLPPEVNPLNLKLVRERSKRSAAAEEDKDAEPVTKKGGQPPKASYDELTCPTSATCVEFQCSLGTLYPEEIRYIALHAILWNSTFLEEYEGVAEIQVQSSARVSIEQANIKFASSSKLDMTVSTSVLSETVIPPKAEVKWWIIAVATLAGVLLLVALVLLLWKCGFFERRRFGPSAQIHKAVKTRNKTADNKAASQRILQHQTSWQVYTD